jgi:hypothetical protein
MATRADVENAINEIENNGNNTAKEVRDVLTLLLDYTENDPSSESLVPFRFEGSSTSESKSKGILIYSFRGFKGFHVNFSFEIKIENFVEANFEFPVETPLFEHLKEIFGSQKTMSFVVPLKGKPKFDMPSDSIGVPEYHTITMVVVLKSPNVMILSIADLQFYEPRQIISSIHFHGIK